jgi:type IV secretory pathway VirB6-like protein
MARRLSILMALLLLASSGAFADPNPELVGRLVSFGESVHAIVSGPAGYLVNLMLGVINKIAVALAVVVFATAGYEAATNHTVLNFDYILRKFYLPYGFSVFVLKHWLNPIPGLGVSFVQIFTNASQELSAYIDLSALDTMNTKLSELQVAIGPLPSWAAFLIDPGKFAASAALEIFIILSKTITEVVTGFSYLGLGVGACLGPLFLFFYIFPPLRGLWFSWVNAMIKYSLYKVVASIVVAIMATSFVNWMLDLANGKWTQEHIVASAFKILLMLSIYIVAVWKIPALVADFGGGSSHAGHGHLTGITSFVRGAFR